MATLTVAPVVSNGVDPGLVAAAGGGDEWVNSGNELLIVNNGSGGDLDVTIATQLTIDGESVADKVVTVPAGEMRVIGKFRGDWYNDADGKVQVTYEGVTSLTVGVIRA